MGENYLRTDERQDVAGSVRHILRCAGLVSEDPQAWKWAALAIHSALQGACVCHLTTTASPLGALTKSNTEEWLAYFEKARTDPTCPVPKTRLSGLLDLLKTVRKPHSAGDGSNANGVSISNSEFEWLARFHNNVRNQLTHFEPMGWSLDISGIPELARLTARIIKQILMLNYGFRHMSKSERASLLNDLDSIAAFDWLDCSPK